MELSWGPEVLKYKIKMKLYLYKENCKQCVGLMGKKKVSIWHLFCCLVSMSGAVRYSELVEGRYHFLSF